jgi:hypothetical protein
MKRFDDLSEEQKTVILTAIVQYGGIVLMFILLGLLFWVFQ